MNNIEFVENLILVRNEPQIYAFSTNTIPNYLKVGDTFRSVDIRIDEWNKKISEALGTAVDIKLTKEFAETSVINDVYFRDYSVHDFLQTVLGKSSLEKANPDMARLYSREFFENVNVSDIEKAIADIHSDYNSEDPNKKYTYYKLAEKKAVDFHYNHDQPWKLRPNQSEVVDSFLAKRDKKELLMYAVMRFGKSFTAMYCALKSGAEKVLIVSAKADVVSEWKATVEKPICFKDYDFLVDKDFVNDNESIQKSINNNKKVAVFLTLQNLSGKDKDGNDIKAKLAKVFETEYDLIIVDETHFGAWAKNYGAALKNKEEDAQSLKDEIKEQDNFVKEHSKLKTKQKLHLSGTPYNLLYDKKFDADNMIATVQFSDILDEKEKWDKEHFSDIENGVINETTGKPYQEFDNPYFGFPRMLRFAFNPTQEIRDKLTALSKNGKWTLTEMFSVKEGEFAHKDDVLRLLKIIDGSDSAEGILSFLDIPKIKEHDVCKHMVMVLPYKSSCDVMAKMLTEYNGEFINLSKYKVLNVAGHNCPSELASVDKVKQVISNCENSNPLQKTITLTVNKMLTGVTVKEWDTMIMLKNTHSAQEYDQAVFRIQNQYVVEYEADDGSILKKDMKPQTILVDFDPMRIFEIQGTSSNIVSAISKTKESLTESLSTELKYFPIVTYNGTNLVKVEPNNIVEIITQYNSQKSILDETTSFVADDNIFDVQYLVEFINAQNKLGLTNKLTADGHNGANTPIDIPTNTDPDDDTDNMEETENTPTSETTETTVDDKKEFNKKFRMCMANILFYVFLSNSAIENLNDVLESIQESNSERERNIRIFNHLKLDKTFIELLSENTSTALTVEINNKIKNANLLSSDVNLTPEKRANNALNRFSRISDSEIVTPNKICNEMLNAIGLDELINIVQSGGRILDIASKTGEFAYSLFDLLKDKVDIEKLKNSIYSIPTSGATYEFTRRMYEILGLNIHNLANVDEIDSYKLLDIKNGDEIDYEKIKLILSQNKPFDQIKLTDTPQEGDKNMKFDAVVGNPPYQEIISKSKGNKSLGKQLFPSFITIAANIVEQYSSLIVPTKWFTSEGQDSSFEPLRRWAKGNNHFKIINNIYDGKTLFDGSAEIGAVNYYLYDKTYNGDTLFVDEKGQYSRPLFEEGLDIILSMNEMVSVVNKVTACDFIPLTTITKGRNAFGITGKNATSLYADNSFENAYELRCAHEEIRYVKEETITKNKNIADKWKIFISKGNGGAGTLASGKVVSILGKPYIGKPKSVCTDSLIPIGCFDTEIEALNLQKYIKTKFVRYMVGILKVSQNVYQNVYQFVPMQDFATNIEIDWTKSITAVDKEAKEKYGLDINEIDAQLYKKYGLEKEEISFIESMIKPME